MDLIEKTANQNRHPWELSRSGNILEIIKNYSEGLVYADIGSGDKFFAVNLQNVTQRDVFAVDTGYDVEGKDENGIICLKDISSLPDQRVDCIVMMDVLEHVKYEKDFIKEVINKLKPQGTVIITVPAMQFLFSGHDVFLKHFRRYNRKDLFSLLNEYDLDIERCHYFYTILLFVRVFSLFIEKTGLKRESQNNGIGNWKYSERSFITRLLTFILDIDFCLNKMLNKLGVRLPGLSLLAVCRKRS